MPAYPQSLTSAQAPIVLKRRSSTTVKSRINAGASDDFLEGAQSPLTILKPRRLGVVRAFLLARLPYSTLVSFSTIPDFMRISYGSASQLLPHEL